MGVGIVFPGQGAQAADMGAPWRAHPAWDAVVGRAEAAVGASLEHVLFGPPAERTREAQLSVLLTSLMAWEAARDEVGEVICFAGHSLGQITALIAAGAITFEDGVRFALQRADATQAAADRRPGRMAALLGADDDQVEVACAAAPDACWPANDNAPGQVVLAGDKDRFDRAEEVAGELGKRTIRLPVAGAFHSPSMAPAVAPFRAALDEVELHEPRFTVYSCASAQPFADPRDELARALIRPVRWRETFLALLEAGAEDFVETGPGTVLSKLARRITKAAAHA